LKEPKKIITIAIHIAVWICFFCLPYIFSPQPKEITASITKYMVTLFVTINAFLLVFYYLNTLVLIPEFLFKKKWLFYLVSIAACFALFIYAPREITHVITGNSEEEIREEIRQEFRQRKNDFKENKDSIAKFSEPKKDNKRKSPKNEFRYFPGSFVVFLLVLTIGICITSVQQWLRVEYTKEKIEHEKLNTELSFLKTQVNPHFFFNTLNNIYSLAVVQSDKTASAVMKLSSIMRYILTETQTDKVPLENEIDFIKNYIDLQLVRLTDKVKVNFNVSGDTMHKNIAPLLFIPFVENAFKYGVSTKDNSEIDIQLIATGNTIEMDVTNTIVHKANSMDTTGIGINNVKRRLILSYPDKHTLYVSDNNNTFKVHLVIDIS
jgi:two-component system LytT family sensor kinase